MASYKPKGSRKLRESVRAARSAREHAVARAQRLPWTADLVAAFERERRAGAALLAGGLAYRLFFWLVSFGLVVAAIASFWVRSDRGSLVEAARSFGLSGVAARSATSAVSEGSHARWYLLAFGLALLLYFGVGAVRALRVAAFIAWQLHPTRLRRPIRASGAFTAVFIVGLVPALFASWVRHHDPALGVLTTLASAIVFVALALVVFRLLPPAEGIRWRSLVPGAVLAGCGVAGIHLFIAYYLAGRLERSPKLYGALGTSTVVLLALFLIARVFVASMFLNASLHRAASGAPDAVR